MGEPVEEITEAIAAAMVVSDVLARAGEVWPGVSSYIAPIADAYGTVFKVADPELAKVHLAIATLAMETASLHNVFKADENQRTRLWQHTRNCLTHALAEWPGEDYAMRELEQYCREYTSALREADCDPLDAVTAVAGRLLSSWLGGSISDYDVKILGRSSGEVAPSLMRVMTALLVGDMAVGRWRRLRDGRRVVPGMSVDEARRALDSESPEAT